MRRLTLCLALLTFAVPASAQVVRDDMWVTNGFVYSSALLANTLYLGGQFNRIGPATGGFMPTDATTGIKTLPAFNVDGAVNAIVADGTGGYIIGGSFKHYKGVERSSLARIDANGDLRAWNPGVNGIVKSIAVGGGRVYLGGDFLDVGGLPRTNAAAVDTASGATVSTSWVPNPTLPVHYIGYLNGLVYMGGEFFDVAGTQRAHGGSFDAVTAAPTQWQPNTDGTIYTMALRYDVINLTTSVYIGGSFTVCGGALRNNFALVDATPNSATFSSALNFDPSPDGAVRVIRTVGNTIPTIYVGGEFNNIAGNARPHLAAFSGTTLKTFNPAPDGAVVTMALSGTTLYIGGFFNTVDHALRSYGAAISTTTNTVMQWDAAAGSVIRAFAPAGTTTWIGGDFTTIGSFARANLAAIDLATGQATSWNPGTNGPVWALESVGGLLYAGGTFGVVAGTGRGNVARFDPNGALNAWSAPTNGPVYAITGRALVPSGNIVYLGGPFTACMGQNRNHLAAVTDAVPTVLTAWNPNAGAPYDVRALAVDGTYVYAGGYFTSLGGQAIGGIGRVDFNGVVSPWNPRTTQPIQAITLTPGTVYLGFGGVNYFPGGPRVGIAEVDKTTVSVTPWNPSTDPGAVVFAIKRIGNTVYVGGLIHQLAGQPREMLGAVDATTAAALPFAPSPSAWLIDPNPPTYYQLPAVLELEESEGQLYAIGQFYNVGGKPHSGVAGIYETTVSVPSVALPAGVALRAAPNPAGGRQMLQFSLAASGNARVTIHDVSGRIVRVLHDGTMPSGPQRLEWDGLSAAGVRVAPGIYFAKLEAGAEHATAKLLRVNP